MMLSLLCCRRDVSFKSAHSIKGGAGTFGFTGISGFTHGVETILDQMRDGTRQVTEDAVQLLLESVDCIAGMIETLKAGDGDASPLSKQLTVRIEAMLANEGGAGAVENNDKPQAEATPQSEPGKEWKLEFTPAPDLLHEGSDPLAIFVELGKLGKLSVEADTANIPDLADCDPEEIYVSWSLSLITSASAEEIEKVFSVVADQCELVVEEASGAKKAPPKKKASSESSSIRVGIDKVDSLLNLVGELVITQSMLKRFGEYYDPTVIDELRDGLIQLERHTRELQESAMQIRMLPINSSFSRFPRLVRDLSNTLGKKIDLVVSGEHTEVDKTVLEKLSDPLVHLVRNSLDHGIEMPEERLEKGKSDTGTLRLSAAHEGGNVVIKVEDDGAGLNRERILQKAVEKGLVSAGENLSDERIDNLN